MLIKLTGIYSKSIINPKNIFASAIIKGLKGFESAVQFRIIFLRYKVTANHMHRKLGLGSEPIAVHCINLFLKRKSKHILTVETETF